MSEKKKSDLPIVKILGLPFFNAKVSYCYQQLAEQGGLMTAPSGPGLASIPKEPLYYQSLLNSDILIPDSGYMVLLWNRLTSSKITRLSGLEFVNYFVETFPTEKQATLFLVNPTKDEQEANLTYLQSLGIQITEEHCYLAPFYGKNVEDIALLALLEVQRPDWVLINIGGGTQEILGSYLKNNLSYKPAIICTGAAIAFKTGKQVDIPVWADKLYLGWLFRILSSPSKYYKRYLEAIPLALLLIKYKDKAVV
jgi:N-acetylglucosaminyldiphosphoundecaprenol N-acetyl-beta-D-mannosaminyltransferase